MSVVRNMMGTAEMKPYTPDFGAFIELQDMKYGLKWFESSEGIRLGIQTGLETETDFGILEAE
jgi:hypothetical protein